MSAPQLQLQDGTTTGATGEGIQLAVGRTLTINIVNGLAANSIRLVQRPVGPEVDCTSAIALGEKGTASGTTFVIDAIGGYTLELWSGADSGHLAKQTGATLAFGVKDQWGVQRIADRWTREIAHFRGFGTRGLAGEDGGVTEIHDRNWAAVRANLGGGGGGGHVIRSSMDWPAEPALFFDGNFVIADNPGPGQTDVSLADDVALTTSVFAPTVAGDIGSFGTVYVLDHIEWTQDHAGSAVAWEIYRGTASALILNVPTGKHFKIQVNAVDVVDVAGATVTVAQPMTASSTLAVTGTLSETADVRWVANGSVTAAAWQILRVSSNLVYNVPTGDSHVFGVNGVSLLTIDSLKATITQPVQGTSSVDGLVLTTGAATVGAVDQWSPAMRITGAAWNSTSVLSEQHDWYQRAAVYQVVSGSTGGTGEGKVGRTGGSFVLTYSQLDWLFRKDAATAAAKMSLLNAGDLAVTGYLIVGATGTIDWGYGVPTGVFSVNGSTGLVSATEFDAQVMIASTDLQGPGGFRALGTTTQQTTVAPGVLTSGVHAGLKYTSPADTGQTAATLNPTVIFDCSATRTFAAGSSWPTQGEIEILAPTYSAASATTMPLAGVIYAKGAPKVAGSMVITAGCAILGETDGTGGTTPFEFVANRSASAGAHQLYGLALSNVVKGYVGLDASDRTIISGASGGSLMCKSPNSNHYLQADDSVGVRMVSTGGSLTLTGAGMAVTCVANFQAAVTITATRFLQAQGAAVTATNNLALGTDGNYFSISGATQINLLASTSWQAGAIVVLYFQSTPTVKNAQTVSGANKPINLAGAVDFVATANDTLTLVYDGTQWWELARSVN